MSLLLLWGWLFPKPQPTLDWLPPREERIRIRCHTRRMHGLCVFSFATSEQLATRIESFVEASGVDPQDLIERAVIEHLVREHA